MFKHMHCRSYIIADPFVSVDNKCRDPKGGQSRRHIESAVTSADNEDRGIAVVKVYLVSALILPAFMG